MNTDDKVGDYIEEPSTANRVDMWDGKVLAPCGIGLRQQWLSVSHENDTAIFMSASLIWLLLLSQSTFEKAQQAGLEMESSWNAARIAVLSETQNTMGVRAKVFGFLDSLATSQKAKEICTLAGDILARIRESEAESPVTEVTTEESEQVNLGKRKRKSPRTSSK